MSTQKTGEAKRKLVKTQSFTDENRSWLKPVVPKAAKSKEKGVKDRRTTAGKNLLLGSSDGEDTSEELGKSRSGEGPLSVAFYHTREVSTSLWGVVTFYLHAFAYSYIRSAAHTLRLCYHPTSVPSQRNHS